MFFQFYHAFHTKDMVAGRKLLIPGSKGWNLKWYHNYLKCAAVMYFIVVDSFKESIIHTKDMVAGSKLLIRGSQGWNLKWYPNYPKWIPHTHTNCSHMYFIVLNYFKGSFIHIKEMVAESKLLVPGTKGWNLKWYHTCK